MLTSGAVTSYGLSKRPEPVRKCRDISKRDMKLNDAMPRMTVDPETYEVRADGELCDAPPATVLPLTKKYFVY